MQTQIMVEERRIGRTGQIQGARMVTSPDRKAKRSSKSMITGYRLLDLFSKLIFLFALRFSLEIRDL